MIDLSNLRRFTGKKVRVVDKGFTYEGEAIGEKIWHGGQVIHIRLARPVGAATEMYAPSDMVKII